MKKTMTFVIVNYLSSQSPFETYDIKDEKIVKRKTTLLEKLLRTASFISYIPTTFTILRYFFAYRK